jgi:hypothetical protein
VKEAKQKKIHKVEGDPVKETGGIVPNIGVDDRLFTEDEDEETRPIVPGDIAIDDRLYTS